MSNPGWTPEEMIEKFKARAHVYDMVSGAREKLKYCRYSLLN